MSAPPDRNHRHDDELLGSLSEAARRQAAEDAGPGPTPAAWHRLQAARDGRARPAFRRWLPVAVAALAALVVGGYQLWRTRPLTYMVIGSVVEPGGYIRGGAVEGADVRFSDGTRIALAHGGRMSVVAPGPCGARLRLEEGEAHLDVVHRPHAAWTVEAGPFVVRVTGTSFDVRWSGADETIEVRMRSGSVKVTGPLVPEPLSLHTGQRLTARLGSHELRIDEGRAAPSSPSEPASPSPMGSAVAPAPEPAAAPSTLAKLEPTRAPSPRPSGLRRQPAPAPVNGWRPGEWQARVAAGESDAIVAEVDRHGLDRALAEVDGPALAALSDAARYARRNELATRTLMEQRKRFPTSAVARTAAFQLGRLADDRGVGATALWWYRRYLTEAPNGPYAAEALGREMLAVEKLEGRAAARPFAREYLQRFPDGTYLLQAHSILANR